jgi:adenylate kinase family enzyme
MMKRIVIIGCGGAGKSTLAREIGNILRIPVIHLDAELWKPNWQMTPKAEALELLTKMVNQSQWIMDGNYGSTMSMRFAAADTIIFLDFPRWLCLWRVIQRVRKYKGKNRPDMGKGCPERLNWDFLTWVWNYRRTSRRQVLEKISQYSQERKILVLAQPSEVKKFLHELKSQYRD